MDLQWHIPVELRDRVLSLIQGSEVATEEAQNDMMKRFIALKDGSTYKVGGAKVTSDASATADVIERIRDTLQAVEDKDNSNANVKSAAIAPQSVTEVDISHLLKKLPLKGSLSEGTAFFLYNIDPALPLSLIHI